MGHNSSCRDRFLAATELQKKPRELRKGQGALQGGDPVFGFRDDAGDIVKRVEYGFDVAVQLVRRDEGFYDSGVEFSIHTHAYMNDGSQGEE